MRLARLGRRAWFAHTYRPTKANQLAGLMLDSAPGYVALSAGIRGWRGLVVGWFSDDLTQWTKEARCRQE